MKTKRHTYKKGWGRAVSALLAFALAAGLVLAAPPLDGLAFATEATTPEGSMPVDPPEEPGTALDLTKPCSLTLKLPQAGEGVVGGMSEDDRDALVAAGLVFDVYKIADAEQVPGYNIYNYKVGANSPYHDVIQKFIAASKDSAWSMSNAADGSLLFRYSVGKNASVTEWADLMEELAKVCFEEKETPAASGVPISDKGGTATDLTAGLYLTVVHGRDIPPAAAGTTYPSHIILDEMKEADGSSSKQVLRSIAYTDIKLYIFQPQLIGLPNTQLTERPGAPDGQQTPAFATGSSWAYDVSAYVKHTDRIRYATLEIVKNLQTYSDPVTFVFEIKATAPDYDPKNPDESKIYRKTVPITFSAPGMSNPVRIADRIPAGWRVTVTETYSGMVYQASGADATAKDNESGAPLNLPAGVEIGTDHKSITFTAIPGGTITVTAPDGKETTINDGTTVTTTFTNDHTTINRGGGSVVNHFEPGDTSWVWVKRTYDPVSGSWTETRTETELPFITHLTPETPNP